MPPKAARNYLSEGVGLVLLVPVTTIVCMSANLLVFVTTSMLCAVTGMQTMHIYNL